MAISATTALILGTVAGAGAGVAASGGFGGAGGAANFAPRDIYKELTDEARARKETLPDQIAAEREYGPQFTQINLQNMVDSLYGFEGGPRQVETVKWVTKPAVTEKYWEPSPSGRYGQGKWVERVVQPEMQVPEKVMETIDTQATPGMLQIMEEMQPRVDAMENASRTATRTADLNDILNLGPQYRSALEKINPDQTRLAQTLTNQAQEELDMGGRLTPLEERAIAQSVRSRPGLGMGGGVGPADAMRETLELERGSTNRLRERQDMASRVIGMNQSLYGDPFLQITGRASGAVPTSAGLMSGATSVGSGGPRLTPAGTDYAADLYNTNLNAAAGLQIADKNAKAGMMSGVLGMFGNVAGGALSNPELFKKN